MLLVPDALITETFRIPGAAVAGSVMVKVI